MSNKIFDSTTDPIPHLRRDVQVLPVKDNGNSYLYFHDDRGYATPNFALDRRIAPLLSLLDGQKSISDLTSYLEGQVEKEQLMQIIRMLDENRILRSAYFHEHAQEVELQYERSRVHQSVTAGLSYPEDPQELIHYLDEAFGDHTAELKGTSAKALYAPHIDPRVGLESYVKAFASIRTLAPKRVVILATSHYAGWYPEIYENSPFILVNKDFDLPLGTISCDRRAVEQVLDIGTEAGITDRDRAHRAEHSIELHLLFLSYLWEHNYEVVPFLIRGLDELYYMRDGHLGQQVDAFSSVLQKLDGDDTFFLISGDLAHFGKKFGDQTAATQLFDEVKQFDQEFMSYGTENKPAALLELIKEDSDPYRICGFPPLYAFLNGMPHLEGQQLSYNLWDEQEKESAVTFGSILYH